ncbi:hypothetical protein ACO2RV_18655 [Ancylobacter sp. VNQ12]|uniref:hypothetical protein n=1 Tax=Ancylobacter sp. VNQ12 TaxID=3400920 RepID=UPI003BFE6BEE
MSEPTDQERWDAYSQCRMAETAANNVPGVAFVISAVTGNFGAAMLHWLRMVAGTPNEPKSCLDLLTPAQREIALRRIKDDQEMRRDDKNREKKY